MITLRVTCSAGCSGWKHNAIYAMNVESYAASQRVHYQGVAFSHCPWCGAKLATGHKAEG